MLSQQDMPDEGMHTIKDLHYFTMTPYDATFKNVTVLFPKEDVKDTLGEYLSGLGKKQPAHGRDREICSRDVLLQRRS